MERSRAGRRDIMDGRLGRGMATGMWDMPRHDGACRAMMRHAEVGWGIPRHDEAGRDMMRHIEVRQYVAA